MTVKSLLQIGDKIHLVSSGFRSERAVIIDRVTETQASAEGYFRFKREIRPDNKVTLIGMGIYSYYVDSPEIQARIDAANKRHKLIVGVKDGLPSPLYNHLSGLSDEYLTDLLNAIQKHTQPKDNDGSSISGIPADRNID